MGPMVIIYFSGFVGGKKGALKRKTDIKIVDLTLKLYIILSRIH